MAMAEQCDRPTDDSAGFHYSSTAPLPRAQLVDEINRLRRRMTEIFVQEASFTSEPVMQISRELDQRINEYMRQASVSR